MLKNNTLLLIFVLISSLSFGQQITKIEIVESSSTKPIESVHVKIMMDKKLLASGYTNRDGIWQTQLQEGQNYTVELSHVGYRFKTYSITSQKDKYRLVMQPTSETMEEVLVTTTRVKKYAPATSTTLTKKSITKVNSGKDMPYVLEQTPSVVTFSDAGAGVGYTGMRIRGVDATRINVTLNGIPYNDAEAHGVFWVDMPDLASSVNSIQIQRGVGTSTNGSAAFGASVNLKTDHINEKRFGSTELGFGSFGTRRINAQLGTGITKSGWGAQARVSLIQSEGFVDRASANLYSGFVTAAHYGKKSLFKFNAILGKEITYQSWYGTPQPKFEENREELDRYINELWIGGDELKNLEESDPNTYNYYTYSDQVDNYTQNHFQAFYSYQLKTKIKLHGGLNYTRGLGYYEEKRRDDDFSFYGLNPVIVGADTFTEGDIIRRRWLDNHFYGMIFSVNYWSKRLTANIGGGQHFYQGGHYGEVIWQEHAQNINQATRYYENNADKSMSNLYAKATYRLTSKLNVYGDLQGRFITYKSAGLDNGGADTELDVDFLFINPKAGALYQYNRNLNLFATYGRANREPVRSDLINSSNVSRPKPEQLDDYEFGVNYGKKDFALQVNAYFMNYTDQLVLTGKINDVGATTRENVDKSYRAGVETSLQYKLSKALELFGNLSYSENKIEEYTEYIYAWDASENQVISHKNTDIALSPNIVSNLGLNYSITKKLNARLSGKYISEQFLDNTSNPDRALDPYGLVDLSFHFQNNLKGDMSMYADLFLYNLANQSYAPNGYTFSGVMNDRVSNFNYVYPQAGFHFLAKLGFHF